MGYGEVGRSRKGQESESRTWWGINKEMETLRGAQNTTGLSACPSARMVAHHSFLGAPQRLWHKRLKDKGCIAQHTGKTPSTSMSDWALFDNTAPKGDARCGGSPYSAAVAWGSGQRKWADFCSYQ